MPGHIEMVQARDLRKGDVFSTDGGIVTSVTLLQSPDLPDEIAIATICHGIDKFAHVSPDAMMPIWREDDK